MTETTTPTRPPQGRDLDPYRLGWRDVVRRLPDGTTTWEQVPLTLEDVLHPQEGDHIVQNTLHDRDWRYLGDVLKARLAEAPGVEVFCDLAIYWDVPELRHHCPDLAVVFGVRRRREMWTSFVVAAEGVRPTLIIEVVSPSTREADLGAKVEQYYRAGVRFYVIVDREREEGPPSLIGYQHGPGGWIDLPPDAQGRLLLEPVGLRLGTRDNRVVLYDADTGAELGDYVAVTRALEAAEERVRAEAEARRAAEERAQGEAEARQAAEEATREEARARQAAEETARAAAERARAEAEARQAAEERARVEAATRADLERRLRELEAQLRRRPNGPASGSSTT